MSASTCHSPWYNRRFYFFSLFWAENYQ
uniref:Uncharacterized protein n=1 Tax=Arundo donax TaxID=35708 RepID=A0A0A9EK20_ARUDO